MASRIFIGGLARDVGKRDIEDFLNGYDIHEIFLRNDFAFVQLANSRDADHAVSNLNGQSLMGKRTNVQFARQREESRGRREETVRPSNFDSRCGRENESERNRNSNSRERNRDFNSRDSRRDGRERNNHRRDDGERNNHRRDDGERNNHRRDDGKRTCNFEVSRDDRRFRHASRDFGRRESRDESEEIYNFDARNSRGSDHEKFRVIIESLADSIGWRDLRDYMSQAGEVVHVIAHKFNRNEGIVDFATERDRGNAIAMFDNTDLHGRWVRLICDDRDNHNLRSRSPVGRQRQNSFRSRSRSPIRFSYLEEVSYAETKESPAAHDSISNDSEVDDQLLNTNDEGKKLSDVNADGAVPQAVYEFTTEILI